MTKFKYLCHAGIKATLTVEADTGEASVTLRAGLGLLVPGHGHRRQHREPLYQQRQEMRQAVREAAGLVQSSAGEVCDGPSLHGAGLADRASNSSRAEEE